MYLSGKVKDLIILSLCVIFIIALFLFGWQISLFHGAEVKNHLELNERSFAYFCVFF